MPRDIETQESKLLRLRGEVRYDLHDRVQKILKRLYDLGVEYIHHEDRFELNIYVDSESDEWKVSAWIEGYGDDYIVLDDDLVMLYALPKILEAVESIQWIM